MKEIRGRVLIVGSGPAGATAAAALAAAGEDVVLAEEGANHGIDSAASYTRAEMDQKYRNGGLNTTLGRAGVTYLEGRCVGGASEINAALYHRPLRSTLEGWARDFRIDEFELDPWFDKIEADISTTCRRDGFSEASRRLARGADALGWKHNEIPRFWKYVPQPDGTLKGRRQSMSETLIPRAVAAGCRLLPDTRVLRLEFQGERAVSALALSKGGPLRLRFDHLILCAGAVQTPLLLRRSGIRQNIGDTLQMHPMIRVVARFDEPVNDPSWGVPVRQVEEFKPRITLGGSHSSLPHLAMWLGGGVTQAELLDRWRQMAIFYVAVQGQSAGKIRDLPLLRQPLVRYDLGAPDLALLGEGLERLGQVLFAAGARWISSPVEGGPPLTDPGALRRLRDLPAAGLSVSTIHLFSSIPMGETAARCAVDSYGKLRGWRNVHVFDASILPTSPGVNPQGTILAIARRNAEKWLTDRAGGR